MNSKKGIFLTLALSFFVVLLLSLTVVFFRQANISEAINTNLVFIQKIHDLDSSIKSAFAEAYLKETGIYYYQKNNRSFTLISSLPKNFAGLNSLTSKLESNLESNFSKVQIHFNDFQSTHGVILSPLGISFNYNSTKGIYTLNNSNIDGYNVSLKLDRGMLSCTNNLLSGGTANINITVISATNNCSYLKNMAFGAVNIMDSDSNPVQIKISSTGALNISVNNPSANYLGVNITVNFDEIGQKGYLYLPMEVEVLDAAFDFNKRSNVFLPLLSEN